MQRLRNLAAYLRPPYLHWPWWKEPVVTTEIDASGITRRVDGVPIRVEWRKVTSVIAWKKDCFAFDQIRLIISDSEHSIELVEDADEEFRRCISLQTYLPQSLPDWYAVLASSPAFSTTVTRVFPVEEAT